MSKDPKPCFLRHLLPSVAVCFSCVSVLTGFKVDAQEPASPYPDRIIIHPTIAITSYHELPLTEVLLSADVITQTEIEASNATSFSALISQKTGVEVTSTGGPGALRSHFLRGQSSTNYVLLIDGIRAQTDYYGNVKTPEIPLSQIQKIEILKGNGSALYGEGAIGGVINVITKSASSKDRGYTSAQYGSYGKCRGIKICKWL